MFAELRMELDSDAINYQQSSNLQGVIMENISSDYAEKLHVTGLNPYSQYVVREKGKTVWYIKTLTDEAYEKILLPMMKLEVIQLKKKGIWSKILSREICSWNEDALVKEFYEEACSRYLELDFLTPTAFKREGKYINYPDLSLVYGSLMRKYSDASKALHMVDNEILKELCERSEIVRYRLQTVPFPLEGIKITGFVGHICIKVNGPETLARYIRMLLKFGEYSGVGIKTGIGMGAISCGRKEMVR